MMDRRVGNDGYRKVIDADGDDVSISDRFFANCDRLAESSDEMTGNDLRFVQAFEIMAPIRDAAMYTNVNID